VGVGEMRRIGGLWHVTKLGIGILEVSLLLFLFLGVGRREDEKNLLIFFAWLSLHVIK
jgi:hypothetical protein